MKKINKRDTQEKERITILGNKVFFLFYHVLIKFCYTGGFFEMSKVKSKTPCSMLLVIEE